MTWTKQILVVANVTVMSDELLASLQERAKDEPVTFTVLVPATPFGDGHAGARDRLHAVIERLRTNGLQAEGHVGDGDPIVAVCEAWDPGCYDEIVIATLPMRVSKWLHRGLPQRISQLTGAPVTHVVCQQPCEPVESVPAPPHERSLMGPLSVLGWGGGQDEADRLVTRTTEC